MNLAGKTVLVTGGASGLGAACVNRFVKAGANVVIADLNEALGKELEGTLGGKALFSKTDITNEDSVKATLEILNTKFGTLSGVINCAGVVIAEKTVSKEGQPHDLGHFTKVIGINLIGAFNVVRLAAAVMAKTGVIPAGVIINTASVAAYDGQIGQTAYAASKGGIVSLTLPLARELSIFGIRVMTIAPGIFETPMLAGMPEKVRTALGAMVPYPPRLGKPDEFAALAQHIFENEMLNGEVIRLDGAIRMAAR